MKITTYKNLHQLTILGRIFPINCYVYEEPDSLTVIDIGTSLFCKHLIHLSKKLNKPIKNILFTHPHSDHISGLDDLKKRIPSVMVHLSERDYLLMKGNPSAAAIDGLQIKGQFAKIDTEPDILITDGMIIGSLHAIATPGHPPGSMSFYNENNGIIIVGDAMQTACGLAVAGDKRFFFPFPALATWNKELAVDSAIKLSKLKINALAAGHGDLLINPKESILMVIDRAGRKLRLTT